MITTLNTDGRPLIPAFVIARTKGEALASSDVAPLRSLGSVYGTRRPMRRSEIR